MNTSECKLIIDSVKARELLIRLVEIPGVTGDESKACEYLARALPAYGWDDARIDAVGNVIAGRGNGDREIILMGHIDTVAGGPSFRLEEAPDGRGEILWGRGSVDARGPLCAFAVAGGAAVVPDGWRLIFIAAVGEEGDSRGARHVIPLYSPKACVIGEPSGTSGITIGYRGHLRIQLSAGDGGAHRSGDAGPATACLLAASDVLREIQRRDNAAKPVIERPSGAVITMEGGEESTGRTGMVDLDVRLPLGADPEVWSAELLEIANEHFRCRHVPHGNEINTKRVFSAQCVSSIPAHVSDKNNRLATALRGAIREAGFAPRLLVKGGTADFNLAAAWQCPVAAYGPGDSKLDHTDKERVSVSEYLTAASILKNALEMFMGV
ncbi:MAG: M20/M25/M40 family metallo-hydrolase [Synergistaceae bacterium]|nr:M20/M25/M40 family metallo-hydrolase [Synergistaceae bacterium]